MIHTVPRHLTDLTVSFSVAGGGGLLAGALLTEGFEHHEQREHREEEEAYDQGQSGLVQSERV